MITNDRRFGSDVIADMLELYDIPFASLNPGASYRGLHDSIVNYKGNRPEIIECPHEKVAVTLAHGYSRAAGKPMAAIVHNLVGLLHGTMGIYYAYTDQAPVLVLGASGPFDTTRRRPGIDWIHTSLDQGAVVREYTKWDDQPYNADSVPESVARAYRVATTPPMGPVYLCFDAALQEDELDHPIPLPNVSRLHTPEPIAGNPRAIERVAEMLLQAKHPVILADSLGRNPDSVARLVELAELMAAPVIDLGRRMNFPNQHPLCANGSNVLEEADLVIGLDCKALEAPLVRSNRVTRRNERIISDSCKVVDISLRDLNIKAWTHDFDKMLELDELVIADTSVAVPQLIDACRTLLSSRGSQEARGTRQPNTRHARRRLAALAGPSQGGLGPQAHLHGAPGRRRLGRDQGRGLGAVRRQRQRLDAATLELLATLPVPRQRPGRGHRLQPEPGRWLGAPGRREAGRLHGPGR